MRALLIDLDGTLVDSRAPTEAAWKAWAQRHGLPADEVARTCHGVPSVQHVADWAPHLDAATEAKRIEAEQVASDAPVAAFDGAADLLATGLPTAIVTSGTPDLARGRLAAAGLQPPAVLVCAGDPPWGKPSPDPYLLGAERLGIASAHCVVIEDAPAGIAAGRAAGARVLAVAHTHPCAELTDADGCFADLRALLRAL